MKWTSHKRDSRKGNRGFTLIELLVSIAIFAIMTGLLVAKYGTFNQSVLLTNLAYDVALSVRTAQTYGVSVSSVASSDLSYNLAVDLQRFQYIYGVDFSARTGENQLFTLFASRVGASGEGTYEGNAVNGDLAINTYAIKRNAYISDICAGDDESSCAGGAFEKLDVTFKRPDPSAHICGTDSYSTTCDLRYAKITLQATDGTKRYVVIRRNGQISVELD